MRAIIHDDLTFEVTLTKKYPQLLSWMTLPFFAPVPPEADAFYAAKPCWDRDWTLDRYPVGTGAFVLTLADRSRRLQLDRNPDFRGEPYPSEGEPGDVAAGLLADAGRPMPFLDRVALVYEKESIPRWNKFLQGWYDASGIGEDQFDSVMTAGGTRLGGLPKERGMALLVDASPSMHYWAFNMRDPVVGGYDPKRIKLRQALSIAFDVEEYLQVFANGRGQPAMSPLVPGVAGWDAEDFNPVVYAAPGRRRSLEEAKRLLAEAGYPGGVGEGGPLVLSFDGSLAGQPGFQSEMSWMEKQFAKLGVQLRFRNTTYRQFREKMEKGTAQMFSWGWNADYPDAENLMFLLYGPNAMAGGGGENAANYARPEFDEWFETMRVMADGPERRQILRRMNQILRNDAPWIWGFHPVSFALTQSWLKNVKPGNFVHANRKYQRIDTRERERMRRQWNVPVLWPFALFAALGLGAWLWRRGRRRARGER